MSYYQRPLRPDELMHGHKYIDKVRTKSGAWRYIYDLAGGRYKKQATKHEAEAKRYQQISDHNYDKVRQYEKDIEINRKSNKAYQNAFRDDLPGHTKRIMRKKYDERHEKIMDDYNKAEEAARRGVKYGHAAIHEKEKAKESKNQYKNSLAYKYDTRKQIVNSTLKKAKKRIDSGKAFINGIPDVISGKNARKEAYRKEVDYKNAQKNKQRVMRENASRNDLHPNQKWEKEWSAQQKERTARENYNKALGKRNRHPGVVIGNTVSKARKQVNRGKNFFKKMFGSNGKITVTHQTY